MNLQEAVRYVDHLFDMRMPVHLEGPTGVGKSDFARQMKERHKFDTMIDFRPSLLDQVDLRGIPFADLKEKRTTWLPPEFLPNPKKHGRTLLFIDEITAAGVAQGVQSALLQLVLDYRLGEYVLPPDTQIMMAGNTSKDRAGSQRMIGPLQTRVARLPIEPNADAWLTWAAKNKINPRVMAFIHWQKDHLHQMFEDQFSNPTPRGWARVSQKAHLDDTTLLFGLAESIVGYRSAILFKTMIEVHQHMPTQRQILNDPDGVDVPDEAAAKWMLATAIGGWATTANVKDLYRYAKRLGPEFSIVAMVDMTRHNPAIRNTPIFKDFIKANKDVYLPAMEKDAA